MNRASTAESEIQPRVPAPRPVRRELRVVARNDAPVAFMPELDRVQAILDENRRLQAELADLKRAHDTLRRLSWGTFG